VSRVSETVPSGVVTQRIEKPAALRIRSPSPLRAVDLGVDASSVGRSVCLGGVGGVALLPEELARAQEQARTQLPPGPVSASSALLRTSRYQRGKSDACDVKTAMPSG